MKKDGKLWYNKWIKQFFLQYLDENFKAKYIIAQFQVMVEGLKIDIRNITKNIRNV